MPQGLEVRILSWALARTSREVSTPQSGAPKARLTQIFFEQEVIICVEVVAKETLIVLTHDGKLEKCCRVAILHKLSYSCSACYKRISWRLWCNG